jgi:hypothetical protein
MPGYSKYQGLLLMLCNRMTFEVNGPYGNYQGICGHEREARVAATAAAGVPVPTVRLCAQHLTLPHRIEIRDRADSAKNVIDVRMADALHELLHLFGTYSNFLTVPGPNVRRFFVLESMDLQHFQRAIREEAPELAASRAAISGPLTLQDAYPGGAPPWVREVMRAFGVRATEVIALDGRAYTVPVKDMASFAAVCERYSLAYEAPPANPEERARALAAAGRLPRYIRVRSPGSQVAREAASVLQLGIGTPADLLTQLNALE